MEFVFTPHYGENVAVSRLVIRGTYAWWQRYWCWPAIAALAVAAVYVASAIVRHAGPLPIGHRYAAAAIYLALFVPGLIVVRRIDRQLSARWTRARHPEQPVTLTIDSDHLQWQRGGILSRIPLAAVDWMFEHDEGIGFAVEGQAIYVPPRAFKSPDQRSELIRQVMDRLSEQSRTLSLTRGRIRGAVAQ
jgi:hypothetical protein